ncbi:MAG TPA: ketol-acid reductoisomerase [Bacteroidales bacterium]|jgi:ketol-acid reductoisomerase|nr:ketol-acid reductoisomerase [Bacteroidales bacterium]MDI9552550.1 ketol-acid reductoisomerase [Bacteroidota bacterium]MZP65536.1 ketol-acid reductoisomerase [Bacteroidales bacterium]HNY53634.1 ketol-acid reductoisomerase [Bacteroidales bacterium]HOG57393.1 ketol-acid reductoisomerase [Bacteroidales bacterium]
MAKIDFGGILEDVVTREEFTLEKAREVLKNETIAVIGYGVQGPAQALNMKDNGINVIVGQAPEFKADWDKAVADGFVPGKTLFDVDEAAKKATIIQYLVSDAAQRILWPRIKPCLKEGDALYFSHGFSITYKEHTGVVPPENIDVILCAPKGSGRSVRRNFLAGAGINSSYSVFQDFTGRANERILALGIAIGSGYLFPTTFEKEVYSDLTGERGVLMGALAGIIDAQYQVLRENGHSPSEAFNETVEELTQSLIRLVDEKGMDWMYSNCSATAQRGALDWRPKFMEATLPVFKDLYKKVKSGEECVRVLQSTSMPNYKQLLDAELAELGNSELWRTGAAVRKLRPGKE